MSGFRDTGPAPKRSEERVRTGEPAVPTTVVNVTELIQRDVEIPEADKEWHEVARWWYESLAESAQCVYYEPSDWMIAYLCATNMSRQLRPQVIGYNQESDRVVRATVPMKGADLSAYSKIWTNLLLTEVDRRRAGIEVNRAIQLADLESLGETGDNVVSFEEAREASIGN